MTEYPKIDTVFDRDDRHRIIHTQIRRPVYRTISRWIATEKIDGTNMRIIFSDGDAITYTIAGRTDNASIPPKLLRHCTDLAERIGPDVAAIMDDYALDTYVLYGEGYGPGIQKGGRYRDDQGFILFDVTADGKFLSDTVVTETAEQLKLPRVPVFGEMTLDEIVDMVREGFPSQAVEPVDPTFLAEGIVARTVEPLYDNRGARIVFKVKQRDFGQPRGTKPQKTAPAAP